MNNNIRIAIEKIARYKDPRDVYFVNAMIGLYRLEAERQYGLIRREIHKQANYIDKILNYAIRDYENHKTSSKVF